MGLVREERVDLLVFVGGFDVRVEVGEVIVRKVVGDVDVRVLEVVDVDVLGVVYEGIEDV